MAIMLGKDATLSVGGNVVGVTNVTWSQSARTIEINAYGERKSEVYQTGYDATLSFEVNDSQSLSAINTAMQDGTVVTVTGGSGNWSFPAVITSISETDPLDGVITFSVEAKMTRLGIR